MTLRIHALLRNTTSEGPGQRFCVWVQGCARHCPGCLAQSTWDPCGGTILRVSELCSLLEESVASMPGLEGVTLLGGEPFLQAEPLSRFADYTQKSDLSVICFTGYTIEQLQSNPDEGTSALLSKVDVLIDGPYEQRYRSFDRPLVGSRNQQFHFLSDRYDPQAFANYKNRVEMRLLRDGSIVANGMAPFFGAAM